MTSPEIPALFALAREGVPVEVERYIRAAGERVRAERGEQRPPGPRTIGFDEDGVRALAGEIAARLRAETDEMAGAKGRPPKRPAEIAGWCWLLHAYCATFRRPAPPELLQLTFAALGLAENRPPPEIEATIGRPVGVRNLVAFIEAARFDGQADARGARLGKKALAGRVKVDERTVRRWRGMSEYQCIRKASGAVVDHGWDDVIRKLYGQNPIERGGPSPAGSGSRK